MSQRILLSLILSCIGLAARGGEQVVAVFALKDHLNHAWQHELVFFPVEPNVFGRKDVTLLGPDDKPAAYQWASAESAARGKNAVAFFASVPQGGASQYRLVAGSPLATTDLRVTPAPDAVRLENGLTGIHVGGPAAGKDGPNAGIRLRSGRWVGGGELKTP